VFGDDYATPDGSCLRDYIHIVDLAQAHVAALNKILSDNTTNLLAYDAFNLGTGVGVSVLELVKEFIKITGVEFAYEIGSRRSGDVEKTYANPAKALKILGWKTKLNYSQALKDAWNWQQKISNLS
jgi:UDP-glucose 4-epimerase